MNQITSQSVLIFSELLWVDQAIKHQRNPQKEVPASLTRRLIKRLQKCKNREQPTYYSKLDDFYETEIYYAAAFIDNTNIRRELLQTNHINELIMLRESIHKELSVWLESLFDSTKNYKYRIWQKLCVESATLSPQKFYEFQDYFAKISKNRWSNEEIGTITRPHFIPAKTGTIQRSVEKADFIGENMKDINPSYYDSLLLSSVYKNYESLQELLQLYETPLKKNEQEP